MADDSGNEDQWLYGDSNPDTIESEVTKPSKSDDAIEDESQDQQDEPMDDDLGLSKLDSSEPPSITAPPTIDQEEGQLSGAEEDCGLSETTPVVTKENGEKEDNEEEEEEDDDDDDSDDDNVQVVIGDIKTGPTYTSINMKCGGLLTSVGAADKLKDPFIFQQRGKFSIEEFEAVGTINGVPAHEFNLDSLEDKPWRKPGADITDYFNYGFNEDTWRAYCERQKRIRIHESGVGLAQIGGAGAGKGTIPVAITNDNSKYSGFMGPKKAGPPPGRKMAGTIDVIGGGGLASRRNLEKGTPPKENAIQVMTADRREYSRKPPPGFPDLTVPPPTASIQSFDLPPPPHGVIPPIAPPTFPPPPHLESYNSEFYSSEADPYYAYEPTQDSQWNDPSWSSTGEVKVISSLVPPLPPIIPPPNIVPLGGDSASQDSRSSMRDHGDDSNSGMKEEKDHSEKEPKERSKDKDRDKSERHRERSHRHRSRSRSNEKRSRRHKSRSRSPGHRSHRKKKSRRSEREKSKEESE